MAYSDSGGRFWQIDLTTRAGAKSATHSGSVAAFAMCAMAVLGAVLFGGLAGFSTPEGIAAAAGAMFEAIVALIAALRFRAGKGVVWGSVAALLMGLEAVAKLATFSLGGMALSGVIAVVLVNGVRGALALRKDQGFDDEEVAVFE